MQDNDIMKFVFNYLTKYFFYGWLCIFGMCFLIFSGIYLWNNFTFPFGLISFFLWAVSIPVFLQLGSIIASTRYKFRYYKISLYRLKTRGYKDSYFECEMHEPCMKLMIKDILFSQGYKQEFKNLSKKCKGRNVRVERAKEKLLERVKKQHRIQEVVNK